MPQPQKMTRTIWLRVAGFLRSGSPCKNFTGPPGATKQEASFQMAKGLERAESYSSKSAVAHLSIGQALHAAHGTLESAWEPWWFALEFEGVWVQKLQSKEASASARNSLLFVGSSVQRNTAEVLRQTPSADCLGYV